MGEIVKNGHPGYDSIHYVLVTDTATLARLCADWSKSEYLALDTEFIRTTTFYPRPGLIQLSDGSDNYLIDPLRIDNWEPFRALMSNLTVTKIFHSCSEDLFVFYSFLGVFPAPIFDTQIATALVNEGFALSYQNLVRDKTGIEIPKSETRSDWLRRPLTEDQLNYAALDVMYLPGIYQQLQEALMQQGKSEWMQEECERLMRQYDTEVTGDYSEYYSVLKGGWQLNSLQLGVLKKLAVWREEKARKRNRPRNWIIKDRQLLKIAKSGPKNIEELQKSANINLNFLKYEASAILEIIRDVEAYSVDSLPELLAKPLTADLKKTLKACQHFVEEKAQESGVAVEIIAPKRYLIALLHNVVKARSKDREVLLSETTVVIPDELRGWRKPILLTGLLSIISK